MSTISSLPSSYQSVIYNSLFKQADTNNDGSVSSAELSAALDPIKSTLGNSTLKADSLFTTLDTDSSQSISETEFQTGLASVASGSSSATSTDATTARQELIASFLKGVQSSEVSTLLGTSDSSSSYSSLSDLYTLLNNQYGTTLSTYSATGTNSSNSLVGALLNTSA